MDGVGAGILGDDGEESSQLDATNFVGVDFFTLCKVLFSFCPNPCMFNYNSSVSDSQCTIPPPPAPKIKPTTHRHNYQNNHHHGPPNFPRHWRLQIPLSPNVPPQPPIKPRKSLVHPALVSRIFSNTPPQIGHPTNYRVPTNIETSGITPIKDINNDNILDSISQLMIPVREEMGEYKNRERDVSQRKRRHGEYLVAARRVGGGCLGTIKIV